MLNVEYFLLLKSATYSGSLRLYGVIFNSSMSNLFITDVYSNDQLLTQEFMSNVQHRLEILYIRTCKIIFIEFIRKKNERIRFVIFQIEVCFINVLIHIENLK